MMKFKSLIVLFASLLFSFSALGKDSLVGQYVGTMRNIDVVATVIAEQNHLYQVNIVSTEPSSAPLAVSLKGSNLGDTLYVFGNSAGYAWNGTIKGGVISLDTHYYGLRADLKIIDVKSPTVGLKPPKNAVVLLPYEPGKKTNLDSWTNSNWELLDDGSVKVRSGASDTKQSFENVKLHVEFYLPQEFYRLGQHRANSGVYFCDTTYEVQVLDSFGFILSAGDCGSLYSIKAPDANASLPAETWQAYDIVFTAPVMDKRDKVIKLPRISVELNGVLIHDDFEIPHSTIGKDRPHKASGPISLQDHTSPVQYRNIWVVELN